MAVTADVLTFPGKLTQTSCAACGVRFAIPAPLLDSKRTNGGSFYCPSGHTLHYADAPGNRLVTVERERDELRTEVKRLQAALDALLATKEIPPPTRRWWQWRPCPDPSRAGGGRG